VKELTERALPPKLPGLGSGGTGMPRNIFFVFVAFGLAIAGGSAFYYVSSWLRVAEGRSWPTTQGTIRSVNVEDHVSTDSEGDRSYTYYPRIAYSYRVGNRTLQGERIWLTGNAFYNDRADAVAFVQDYSIGQSVPVVYDPEHPGEAALLVENPPWQVLLFTAFGLLWIAIATSFRMEGRGARKRQASCRSCGAPLPQATTTVYASLVPGEPPTPGLAGGPQTCPRCGERQPTGATQNKTTLILFLILFFGSWAAGLYAIFLA